MEPFRACYWLSDDAQSELVLTLREQAHMSDEELLGLGREEADRVGLTLEGGTLRIGMGRWYT